MIGITAFGAYLPRLRLQRSSVVEAHSWFSPELKKHAKGERAVANWDEDPITMAVESARDCLPEQERGAIANLIMASTTMPFADRQNSVVVKEALNLSDTVATLDVTGSQRAGVSALSQALSVANSEAKNCLCVASEKASAKPASEAELLQGHGAAALVLGSNNIIAKHLASYSVSADFVDHFRAEGEAFNYEWESRWIREEGFGKIAPQAINGALEKAGLTANDIDKLIVAAPEKSAARKVAKECGIPATAIAQELVSELGYCGVAQPLLMLSQCLETAKSGERILVTGFGNGCDAIIFERTELELPATGSLGVSGWAARRSPLVSYTKYLTMVDLLKLEVGMRAEFDEKQPLTALWRHRRGVLGLVGSRCQKSGEVQFPQTEIAVSSDAQEEDRQEPYPLAERPARILTFTEDRLTYTPVPPACYGMIEFVGGGRLHGEFCDVDEGDMFVGAPMRMMFRIKAKDQKRGFKRYFWKAAPTGEETNTQNDSINKVSTEG